MLRRDDDGVDALRRAVGGILHGDLALAVRAEPRQLAALAAGRQGLGQVVCVGDRGRHQLARLMAGEAEHHALIARADLVLVVIGAVDAHGDVRRLPVQRDLHGAAVPIIARRRVVIADFADRFARDVGHVDRRRRGDLAHDEHQARCRRALAGHARHRVLRQRRIEHAVGHAVADLIGMPLGHRFGGKDPFFVVHKSCSFPFVGI